MLSKLQRLIDFFFFYRTFQETALKHGADAPDGAAGGLVGCGKVVSTGNWFDTRFFAIGRKVKHHVYVKQVIAVPVRRRREKIALCDVLSMTTETYKSHLFRSDKKSEFILIARFTLPLASWMLKLPKIVSPIPPLTSYFTPTPTRSCPPIHLSLHTHTHTLLSSDSPHTHTHTHTHTPLSPHSPLTSHPHAPVPPNPHLIYFIGV